MAAGTQVWLEIDFQSDGATIATASIGSGSGGWSGFPTPFAYTGDAPDQVLASAFLLIGYVVAASSPLDGDDDLGRPADGAGDGEDRPVRDAEPAAARGRLQRAADALPLPASRAVHDMKLTYCDFGYFPFLVPEKDASFASSVGPQTVYPAGFSLGQAMQIYWQAQNYTLSATGNGVLGGVTQALAAGGQPAARNAIVGHGQLQRGRRPGDRRGGGAGGGRGDAADGAGLRDDHGQRRAGQRDESGGAVRTCWWTCSTRRSTRPTRW